MALVEIFCTGVLGRVEGMEVIWGGIVVGSRGQQVKGEIATE